MCSVVDVSLFKPSGEWEKDISIVWQVDSCRSPRSNLIASLNYHFKGLQPPSGFFAACPIPPDGLPLLLFWTGEGTKEEHNTAFEAALKEASNYAARGSSPQLRDRYVSLVALLSVCAEFVNVHHD